MISAPENWYELFDAPHRTEYMLTIDGVDYPSDYIQEPPKLTRPVMDAPAIGRVCSATLTVTVRSRESEGLTIAKAAEVVLFCRLADDTTETDWVSLGVFLISSRKEGAGVITLTCRDLMLMTGRTYFDKASFDEWPQPYEDVVADIAEIIGVGVDPRNVYPTGSAFVVDTWGDDTLMSEVLAGIAAGCGGNFIMSNEGNLRLVPFSKDVPTSVDFDPVSPPIGGGGLRAGALPATPDTEIGQAHRGFALLEAGRQTITRVILTVQEEEEYEAGANEDTGITLEASCAFANQTVANYVYDEIAATTGYLPFSVTKAYLDPLAEPGDLAFVQDRAGNEYRVILNSLETICNVGFQTDIASNFNTETGDEFPYETVREVQTRRAIKTSSKYFGNSITHTEGFKSEHESGAYALFNAGMIRFVDENGNDCFYYDAQAGTFILAASATPDVYTQISVTQDGLTVLAGKVDEIAVGGRNLIRHSNEVYTNTSAPTASYYYGASTPEEGEEVTLQINGSAGADTAAFTVYNSGENGVEVELITLTSEAFDETTSIYKATFNWKITEESTTAENTMLKVYSTPTDNTRTATINWIKLERGNTATDWTPAPEDQLEATEAAEAAAGAAQEAADTAVAVTRNIEAVMQFTVQGLKISGTEASRDSSYVLIGADKQTFYVDNVEVMSLGADGVYTQGNIEADGAIKGGSFNTGHWTITENTAKVWSLNYHA